MKTKLDLYLSAQKAAIDSLALKTTFEIREAAQKAFKDENLDARDFDFWIQTFDQQRQVCEAHAKQKSFSPATQE